MGGVTVTYDQWLRHFEEAYKIPFRNDTRINSWQIREFSTEEKIFLQEIYSEELKTLYQQDIMDIVQIMTRYIFKIAENGYTFCPLDKIKSMSGKTIEENYGVSSGYFYNLAKTYWTFRLELDEQSLQLIQKRTATPLFFMILRTVETTISGSFFPTGGSVSEENQRMILKEFAPEINIEKYISENPMLRGQKGGCLGMIAVLLILFTSMIVIIF